MRGASAVDAILQQRPDDDIRVFTVWEPILRTDVGAPRRWALGTMPDRRVQQYWDPETRVATQLARDARPPQPEPECCERAGVLWDIIAVYPPGAVWSDRMPPAVLFNGPLVELVDTIEAALARETEPSPGAADPTPSVSAALP